MTITEANRLNVLLRYLCEIPGPTGEPVTGDEAQAAAEYLADRAYKALSAGIRAVDVAETPITGLCS